MNPEAPPITHGSVTMLAVARAALRAAARNAAPNECCGLLGGRGRLVERLYPVPNVAGDPRSRFEMEPAALWEARCRARAAEDEILGFYHSHPRTPPRPSAYDVERAYYPDAVYVIVGPMPHLDVRAFRIAGGCTEELVVAVIV